MHENFPAGGIITNGLGNDACRGLVIQSQFHLFCFTAIVGTDGGATITGGSKPMSPGEIQSFYKPVPLEQQPYLTDYDFDPLAPPKGHVTIKVTLLGKTMEKEYIVPPKRYKTVIKIIELSNVTKARISAVASGLKRITTRAVVSIRNLQKKK